MVKRVFCLILLLCLTFSVVYAEESYLLGKPLETGRISSYFGKRNLFGRTFHYGLDIAVPKGTPVYAAESGTVTISRYAGSYGFLVEIQHEGSLSAYKTRYGHNARLMVSQGQKVGKGQLIAYSGNTGDSTGPHLHFEVRLRDHPIDPLPLIDTSGYTSSAIPPISDMIDYGIMGLENLVITFFNTMEEKVARPLFHALPAVAKVDFDVSKIEIVKSLHGTVKKVSFMLLPFLVLIYIAKMALLNLIGHREEFIIYTFKKVAKASILMYFSLALCGGFLGFAYGLTMIFVNSIDMDFSKVMYSYGTATELFSAAGINTILSILSLFIYTILFVVVMIRVLDVALMSILSPMIIEFAEFIDRGLYKKLITGIMSAPIAQFVMILCLAFSLGFAEYPMASLENLGPIGKYLISITSAIYALLNPGEIKRIFSLSSIETVDALLVSIKGGLVAYDQAFGWDPDDEEDMEEGYEGYEDEVNEEGEEEED